MLNYVLQLQVFSGKSQYPLLAPIHKPQCAIVQHHPAGMTGVVAHAEHTLLLFVLEFKAVEPTTYAIDPVDLSALVQCQAVCTLSAWRKCAQPAHKLGTRKQGNACRLQRLEPDKQTALPLASRLKHLRFEILRLHLGISLFPLN